MPSAERARLHPRRSAPELHAGDRLEIAVPDFFRSGADLACCANAVCQARAVFAPISAVVPANAGTHTPCRLDWLRRIGSRASRFTLARDDRLCRARSGRDCTRADQLLNFTPVIASRLPCQIFSFRALSSACCANAVCQARAVFAPISAVVPANAGTHLRAAWIGCGVWVPGLATPARDDRLCRARSGRDCTRADQLLNFTPVIASRLPCQIFSLSAFGISMPSMMRSVSRVYMVPFSGSNGQSEANTILSGS